MIINYGSHYLDNNDIKSVIKQLKSPNITQGNTIEKFEEALKKKLKAKYCVTTSSGTGSLHLISLSYNWKKGDIIFTTPNSFVATSNCILYSGATPVFIDICKKSYNIDTKKLEKKLKSYKKNQRKNLKAVIATDFAGNPNNWKKLKEISLKYNVKLINDNCHALGASYYGSNYAAKYADCINLSFHAVKNITTGEGGAILTNDYSIYKKAKLLRTHGIDKSNNKKEIWFYDMKKLGFNYRITDIQCALGLSQLKKLKKFINKRRQIARIYDKAFSNDKRFIIPPINEKSKHAYHLYPLQIKFEKLKIKKKDFFKRLLRNKIKLQVHYIPIHFHSYYKKKFGYKIGSFPITESFYKREVSLPIYFSLSLKQVRKIIQLIKNFAK